MKLFSTEAARAVIPQVARLVDELLAMRRSLAIHLLERDPALRSEAPTTEDEREVERRKRDIVRAIGYIETFGCIVKDIDLGLLDFPAVREGRRVYLCWKAGEPELAFWHGTDESFAGRKAL